MPDFQPLRGIRVVDLTSNMSGPLATMVLADQGADVLKVEPLGGDIIRTVGTGRGGMSAYFANVNRGKRSIAVDLSKAEGRDLVLRLAEGADVFAQNFKTGVADRLGVGPADVRARNERLVYLSISGFGPDGPLGDAPAYDHVVQALSGFAALQSESAEPAMVRHGAIDKATAYSAAQAVTAALFQRERGGTGALVEVSMLDVAIAFLWPDGMMNHTVIDPEKLLPPVHRSFKLTPTADGQVALVTLTAGQWQGLVDALLSNGGTEDTGPDLSDTGARMAGGAEVMRKVRARIATMPTAEVVEKLTAASVPVAPVVDLDAVHEHPQVVASGTVVEMQHSVIGPMRQPRPAPVVDGVRPAPTPAAPRLGEHTDAVLAEAGLDADEVAALRADGVVG
jgi:crotonobetainyl-CoA:carnitine CoA-transferase CaiB-like acyl-CoA transferase